ncbi:MAG: hypothetical protein EHM21_19385, partial [Chloroflexi bacterium]
IRSLSSLIDDLFEMAQMDAGGLRLEMASVSMGDLVSDTLEQFSVQAQQAGVTLEGSAATGAVTVNGSQDLVVMDVGRIGRVLANLVSNALRHTPAGGRVTITASRQGPDLLIRVTDTGEGIQPEDLPYVFERFYRGEKSRNRSTGGAGLGLAIARSLVELHGGQIGVKSKVGGRDGGLVPAAAGEALTFLFERHSRSNHASLFLLPEAGQEKGIVEQGGYRLGCPGNISKGSRVENRVNALHICRKDITMRFQKLFRSPAGIKLYRQRDECKHCRSREQHQPGPGQRLPEYGRGEQANHEHDGA